jgi:hypothetical protein
MSAQQVLAELDNMEGLTLDDWSYIQAHGTYKSVKNLAKKMMANMAESSDETPTKKPSKAKKAAPVEE